MSRLNRVCFTCGEKHAYCPDCYSDRHLETWHIMFDNENCKTIFEVLNKHFYKYISTDDAIKELEKCNLDNIESFNENIKNDINNILSKKISKVEPKVKAKAEIKVINPKENKANYFGKK